MLRCIACCVLRGGLRVVLRCFACCILLSVLVLFVCIIMSQINNNLCYKILIIRIVLY